MAIAFSELLWFKILHVRLYIINCYTTPKKSIYSLTTIAYYEMFPKNDIPYRYCVSNSNNFSYMPKCYNISSWNTKSRSPNLQFLAKLTWQMVHLWGFNFSWIAKICIFNVRFSEKLVSQMVHSYALIPSCRYATCLFNTPFALKLVSQMVHYILFNI